MSDLYPGTSETSEPTADGTQEPSRDWTRYEPGPEGGRSHEHRDAGTQTMLADEDRLPTRQDARAATWGDNPVYEDEDDPGAEDEGDFGTLTADEDQLPTRQDARAATWGDNPVYKDEDDPDAEYDGDLGTLTAEDHALDSDTSDLDQAVADEAGPTAGRPDDSDAGAPDSSGVAAAEQVEEAPADTRERITALEAENAQLGKTIADLQARLERLEHAGPAEQGTGVTSRERDTRQWAATESTEGHPRRWGVPSDEGLALGAATAGGMLTAMADYVPYVHADIAGIVASGAAVGAAGITWMRSRREGKHGHRSED